MMEYKDIEKSEFPAKDSPGASSRSVDQNGSIQSSYDRNTVNEDHDTYDGEPLDWTFSRWVQDFRESDPDHPQKHLHLTYRSLTVTGKAVDAMFGDTFWSTVNPREIWHRYTRSEGNLRTLIHDFTGQVKPGEMMLVLGRPGSGCTTFLKALANKRSSYVSVTGDVSYGTMDDKYARQYRQQILFNNEEDIHFPTLAVGQMMRFTLQSKTPRTRPGGITKKEFVKSYQESILRALGIHHTKQTVVGNEFIRGVSGGERKRVSIAEVMASQSPIQFWDNSTRGLDASTALDFAQALRTLANKERKTILASFYQTGNGIYDLFDKVIVIDAGRVIYYGPRSLAREYFEHMGFVCPRGGNIADFLTSVTVLSERQVRPGWEDRVPRTAHEFEMVYRSSDICKQMSDEIVAAEDLVVETEKFEAAVQAERQHPTRKHPYTVSLFEQIVACTIRQYQIIWGDRFSLALRILQVIVQALVCGSIFYNLPDSTTSVFKRPGAIFFPIMYFCMQSMSETVASFMGRPILTRQKDFGLYRPTAYCIACILTDIPVVIVQVTFMSIVLYWMFGFQANAGKFFIYWLNLNAVVLCYMSLFRSIGALCKQFGNASKISGFITTIMMVYAGYLIPFSQMHPWFKWLVYLNPAAYTFEALTVNEFQGRKMACEPPQLIPYGPTYTNISHQTCAVAGGGITGVVDGLAYAQAQFGYTEGYMWRGFGVVVAFWVFYTILTAVGFERLTKETSTPSALLLKRGKRTSAAENPRVDEENQNGEIQQSSSGVDGATEKNCQPGTGALFAWKNVDYTVNVPGGKKQLLDHVSGFVKPGQLVALMGSSGAGKTTLLDVLAQRKDSGVVEGEVTLNGKPLDAAFQRSAGYCEQLDIHEPSATVREALEFSALLRQPESVPRDEKLAYVDEIIRLLELEEIQDALVGSPGAGLSIEQRKRLTIGVELVSKPSILFLDEPTSGLDGQSAFNILRFVKKLAASGQAVLCTIHQPSASLFENFDALFLLCRGGKTAYFGETGPDSHTVLDYFTRHGAPCPPHANPAEHIVSVVQGRVLETTDWPALWRSSPEHLRQNHELDRLKAEYLAITLPQSSSGSSEFASTLYTQLRLVTWRHVVALWRKPDYVWNKIELHILSALFAGFTFWQVGDGTFDLQLRVFAAFNFVFVSAGVMNQLQPLFIANRDVFEAREKKSKTYSWVAFVTAQLVAEVPWLILCGFLYFACYYFTVGFPADARVAGQVFLQMIVFEFLYTAIGQAIAAPSPNAYFASLLNPLILGAGLISFAGVVAPYATLPAFWRRWIYWLDPFHYLMDGLLTQPLYAVTVHCKPGELSAFAPPAGESCGAYMAAFFEAGAAGYLVDPESRGVCEYCPYATGGEYAQTFNLLADYYGWRGTGITILFCVSSYACVYLLMKLRSKKTKAARGLD